MSFRGEQSAVRALSLSAEQTPFSGAAIAVCGLNHKTAPVSLRERLAIPSAARESTLDRLLELPSVSEAVVLSTCNRVEIILGAHHDPAPEVEGLFADISGASNRVLRPHLYHYRGLDAVEHLFKVACGLDSMILGEPQILGQVKDAFEAAVHRGATKAVLNRLFQRAFFVAKAVRSQTGIGRNSLSVGFAARELAAQIFGDLKQATVMLIGAGEMGSLTLKHLTASGVKQVFIVNKTLERALDLAEHFGGTPVSLANLGEFLPQADIVLGCASLTVQDTPLVSASMAAVSQKKRGSRPQFFVDLGVPRNFAEAIDELSDAFLFDIDDLEKSVRENLDARRLEAVSAEVIVREEVQKFGAWLERRHAEHVIRDLMTQVADWQDHEIRRALRRVPGASSDQLRDVLEDFSSALLAKVLHQPFQVLKEEAGADTAMVESFRTLFLRASPRNRRGQG